MDEQVAAAVAAAAVPAELGMYSFVVDRRHDSCGVPKHAQDADADTDSGDWRMRERLKTVSVALVLCLNIGIDPPDVLKTIPCAKTECWVDPLSLPPQKALETIGKNLQQQYEVWQPRARYKSLLDPSVEETKKACLSLRKNAKDERILFHYNGHGVPKPTKGGEIWVFNRSYTQYLPCSIYDLQTWLGSPCIYVFDCSNAGNILNAFDRFSIQRDEEHANNPDRDKIPYISMKECILLAACNATDTLPMNPDLPADLFTCCLTTPIEIALRWFVSHSPLLDGITADMIMKIPGQLNDRRTALGELNWIFTAITDTIAWNMLPHDVFKKLFRQDLMVAALFRNFLLAERIMRYYHCSPLSHPPLPSTHQHPLWSSWDLAAELCLHQLPELLKSPPAEYQHSAFFSDQLTAFEVWLSKGPIAQSHPEQLPIVLQVLLSQVHRLRALMLLSRFLDLGPWSVKLALSVGIFPYVLKLLQSPAAELKPVLVFIWAKILALDSSCQNDLLKDNGFTYFINILTNNNNTSMIPNIAEHRAMCCFILCVFCHHFRFGQEACVKNELLHTLAIHFEDEDSLLRQWVCISLAKTVEGFPAARDICFKDGLHRQLVLLLGDDSAEVRSAALFAVGALIQPEQAVNAQQPPAVIAQIQQRTKLNASAVELCVCRAIIHGLIDASPLVRKELVIVLSKVVALQEDRMARTAATVLRNEKFTKEDPIVYEDGAEEVNGFMMSVYKALLGLSADPYPLVALLARHVVDMIHAPFVAAGKVNAPVSVLNKRLSSVAAAPGIGSPGLNGVGPSSGMYGQQQPSYLQPTPSPNSKPRKSNSVQSDLSSLGIGSASIRSRDASPSVKRHSSFVNPFKSFQGLASLVSFPAGGSALAGQDPKNSGQGERYGTPTNRNSKMVGMEEDSKRGRKTDLLKSARYHMQLGPDGKESICLKSTVYEWNVEYFREPQMKLPDIEAPGSTQYNEKLWRFEQTKKFANSSLARSMESTKLKFDHQVNFLRSDNNPGKHIYFHSFEPHLLGADDADGVIVYNWEDGSRINWFSNSNPVGSRITSLRFINENDIALIVTGSDEGMVRVYKNYASQENCELATSWRAVNEDLSQHSRSELIVDWHQKSGSLLVAGDLRLIRVWDMEKELCVQDIANKNQQAITALASDKEDGRLLVAGYADGLLNLYDRRVPTNESVVMSFREHPSRVLNCKLQNDGTGSYHTLVSGSSAGDVLFWDIRSGQKAQQKISAVPAGVEMTALAIHDDTPLIACGSNTEYIRIFNVNGMNLNTIRFNDGLLGSRIGHVGCVAFHPYKDLLAAGTTNNASICLFSSQP
ncbi:raptor N-terminal caspase like domain-containing protein [Chytriomyces cf. hyalinus JEL632]|nr:raptor N-terminal caspase like domain-containing protein [Chytriomyces cf. hyalinus JEL632]